MAGLDPDSAWQDSEPACRSNHPYLAENEQAARWVDDGIWWYRASFAAPDVVSTGYNYFTRLEVPQPGTTLDRNHLDLRTRRR